MSTFQFELESFWVNPIPPMLLTAGGGTKKGIVITSGGFEVNSFPPMPLQPGGGMGKGIWLLRDVSELTRSPQWLYSQMGERGKWY